MAIPNDQIAIVHGGSASINNLSEITFENHSEYASRHGYVIRTIPFGPSEGLWGKIRALKETCTDPHIRRIFWIDADAIFTNLEISLTSHLPMGKIVMAHDIFGPNAGCIWLENCPEVRRLLEVISTQGYELFSTDHWGDQAAYHYFFRWPPYNQLITLIEQTRMNSYHNALYAPITNFPLRDSTGQWEPGHFILHLPGVPSDIKINILKNVILSIKNKK